MDFLTESLKEMTFRERNSFLAEAWSTSLTAEERDDYNSRIKTEKVLSTKEQIKRTLKRLNHEVKSIIPLIKTPKGEESREMLMDKSNEKCMDYVEI